MTSELTIGLSTVFNDEQIKKIKEHFKTHLTGFGAMFSDEQGKKLIEAFEKSQAEREELFKELAEKFKPMPDITILMQRTAQRAREGFEVMRQMRSYSDN